MVYLQSVFHSSGKHLFLAFVFVMQHETCITTAHDTWRGRVYTIKDGCTHKHSCFHPHGSMAANGRKP